MRQFDFNKYLKSNPLLKEAALSKAMDKSDDWKRPGPDVWFSDVNYFKKTHKYEKLKPNELIGIGDEEMTYYDALKKYVKKLEESFSNRIKKKSQKPGMEESFTDRINASADKKKQVTNPVIAKLLPILTKEAGNEYEAVTQKNSKGEDLVFVIPNNIPASNYYNGAIGAVVVPQSNGTVTIGMAKDSTNDDVFFSKKDSKIFNSNDTESILDHIAMILSKVEMS